MRIIALALSVFVFLSTPLNCLAESAELSIEEGTPVKLKLEDTVSTKTATEGQKLQFTVAEDVLGKDNKTVVIKEGTPAAGYLVNVDDKSTVKGGKVSIEINSTKAIDGSKVALRGIKTHRGKDGASVGAYILGYALFGLIGLGVVALSSKSKEGEMPAGTIITAFVDRDTHIALADSTKKIVATDTTEPAIAPPPQLPNLEDAPTATATVKASLSSANTKENK